MGRAGEEADEEEANDQAQAHYSEEEKRSAAKEEIATDEETGMVLVATTRVLDLCQCFLRTQAEASAQAKWGAIPGPLYDIGQ